MRGISIDGRLNGKLIWVFATESAAGSPASGDYIDPHIEAWSPFRKTRTVNLPDELFEKYDREWMVFRRDESRTHEQCPHAVVQSHFNMGLLPEIERAWLTVDHRLFLWDYKDG